MAEKIRAAVSIASNIAEGFGRSQKEFAHFQEIALGSLAELETQTEIALRIRYLTIDSKLTFDAKMNSLGRQLNVLHQRTLDNARR